jgi:DNA invertase Pin-like site-specific DNA recombinase
MHAFPEPSFEPRQKRTPQIAIHKPGLRAQRRSVSLAKEGGNSTPDALANGVEMELAYARVSTESGEQLDALKRQLFELENMDPMPMHIFVDVQSGGDNDREQYTELKKLIQQKRVKRVRCTHASRLGRDVVETTSFIKLADESGCVIETLKEGRLTLKDSARSVMSVLFATFSQNERTELSIRIKRGYEAGRQMRKPMRKPPWGYRLTKSREGLEPDPETWGDALEVVAYMRECGFQAMQCWKHPKVPFRSIRGLTKWFENPILRGGIEYNASRVDENGRPVPIEVEWDLHERLITDEDYVNWVTRRHRNRRMYGANYERKVRAFTGLLRCTECMHKLKYISGRSIPSLRCNGDGCSQHYRGIREVDVITWAIQEISMQAYEKLAAQVNWEVPPEAKAAEQKLKDLISKYGDDPDMQEVIETKRARLEAQMAKPNVDEKLLSNIAQPGFWATCDGDVVVELLQRIVKEIQITNQRPTRLVLGI